ncbi:MAG: hypothetical protein UW01_C0001G0026 [Candidatus Nomurabacteria bacterium GW2011_GWA2_43_66]|uniref:Uncharacterized protein n=1 Tax=Candidatus Nomurabacteria bacterium GW2011_GWF2_43_24 TaxID=1618778 RepID=A0A0G1HM20_9BACT|nr:MAG: hypothetical protein UV13_C0001G0025 [Parcubacteria group bacterium GW2011_GWC1_42_21]KKS58571.1 MAG: hypothetical protein UV23_C0004G0011 [Candidatus Nomurabacteria bacterium GW2011_GWF1_42_40]KKT00755.1 MAG: hypothetical protein UV77_C0001G0126 [Candidatus Nomurabacteria bacterium GW2011_GWA1_43_17]KKT07953.1 MAG: hypothetical protein UV85_C0003G0078 [Candidatus Nomurabacteria bacterium GW2011_GWB1_43_19]KKT11914.1 MAG: hypothetical protein UV91_C0001G0126 [Candidatus Nomurabacteria b
MWIFLLPVFERILLRVSLFLFKYAILKLCYRGI